MRALHISGLLILICGLATACNTSSNVILRNPNASNSNPTFVANGIAPSEGGFMAKSTTSSYTTNLSVGAPVSSVQLNSGGGYKILLNLQGQLAP